MNPLKKYRAQENGFQLLIRSPFHSIKGKLFFAFFALICLALIFQFVYLAPALQKRKIADIKQSQIGFARYLATEINSIVNAAVTKLEESAALPVLRSQAQQSIDSTIAAINASNQFFNYHFIMDTDGRWLSYPTRPELVGKKIPIDNMKWVEQTFAADRTIFLDMVKSRIGTLVSGISTPIKNENGQARALLRGVFVVSKQNILVRTIENISSIKDSQAYLVSSNGWLIAHSHRKLNTSEFDTYRVEKLRPVSLALQGQTGITEYVYEGKSWVAAYHTIDATKWGLIVQQPLENVITEASAEARFIISIFIGCFCIGLSIAALIVQKSLRPLFKLIKNIQSGSSERASDYPRDEIGQLADQYHTLYSDLYQSTKQIQKSEKKFRTLFNNASDPIFIHDFEGKILEANQNAVDYSGYQYNELLTMKISDINAPEFAKMIPSRIDRLKVSHKLLFETHHMTKAGKMIPAEVSSRTIEYDDQEAILSVFRDLTERKKAEQALMASHKTFLTVLDGIDATIYVADMDTYEILFMNKYMIESFGENLTGQICWDVFRQDSGPCAQCTNDRLLDKQGEPTGVCVWQDKNPVTGRWYINYDRAIKWIDDRYVRLQIATDITEIKMLEDERRHFDEKIRQAQKMESLGTLAGGVAHDFNNLLMGIQGHLSLMTGTRDTIDHNLEHIAAIEKIVQKATDLTRQLLGLARGGKYDVKPVDLNELLSESVNIFARTRKEIQIHTRLNETAIVAEVDRQQIEQALLNLYVNAWQAMHAGGDLYVETSMVKLDEDFCNPYSAKPGNYANISVRDSGMGMDEATCKRVFDPFFTTKEKDRGTGLGLASAYGIIKNHHGIITVESTLGQGSTFNLYLPISNKKPHAEKTVEKRLLKGNETILLVDDEEMIRDVGQAMLAKLGYKVIVAKGGAEAIKLLEKERDCVELVILDLIMPGMDGGKTFDQIRKINPYLPVILSSGYAINGHATEIMNRGCNGFIQKPFNLNTLSQKIRHTLD